MEQSFHHGLPRHQLLPLRKQSTSQVTSVLPKWSLTSFPNVSEPLSEERRKYFRARIVGEEFLQSVQTEV